MRRLRRQLLELVATYGVDVVQTRGLGTLDFLVASLALARPSYRRFSRHAPISHRVKVWWTIENTRFMVRAEHLAPHERWMLGPKRAAHRLLYRAGARLVDGIIVVSDETETSFRDSVGYRGAKLHVVENAADIDRFDTKPCADEVRRELGLDAGDHVMTMVGTFKRQKGHEYLIDALRTVAVEHPELQVLLVGDGELIDAIRGRAADAGLTCVHVLGSRRDVDRLLAASDSFVLPSLWEGLPVALVEATAAGLPVIATDVSGSGKVVVDGATGWLVPPGDAEALADAIDALLADPARATAMGRAGRHRAREQFSAANQAGRLAALFRPSDRRRADAPPQSAEAVAR
jgi:glycosyltransferase involved in cell wall biosynthesis